MERLFAIDMAFSKFLRNTVAISCLSLGFLLIPYVALTPGFATMLSGGGPALSRFLRQVLTNGLPVVVVINYIAFFQYALIQKRRGPFARPLAFLVIDPLARITVFIALHALIYVLSADWFGSFGGDHLTALRVVGPTLARSALFENISGVYLYATLVSALPLYATFHGKWLRRPPLSLVPIIFALGTFACFVLLLNLVALAIVGLQT